MRLRVLLVSLALTLGSGLVLPGQAEARHRHGRHCRHGAVVGHHGPYWDGGRSGSRGYYEPYGYYGRYRGYRYDGYYDRHDSPYRYRSHRRGRLHLHGRVRCFLPHLSIHLGW